MSVPPGEAVRTPSISKAAPRWFALLGLCGGFAAESAAQRPSVAERFAEPPASLVQRESRYWRRTPLAIPDTVVAEVSGLLALPNRQLVAATRRGEIWLIDGAYGDEEVPRFRLFASGLHEPLGIAAAPGGGYYVAQRPEITLVADRDGDGRADSFTTVYKFPLSGSYHEYAFGPVLTPEGNLRVSLNVAFSSYNQSPAPWRGWMVEITPDGQMTPIAAGLRSPAGLLRTSQGLWLYSENQGEWVGSGHVTEVQPGDFMGHLASLNWSKLPGSSVKLRPGDVPADGSPLPEVARQVPGLKLPTVWFPHTILGISLSDIVEDLSGGRFGPFAGQFFVGDQGQSKLMRMTLEAVKGVWQGASYEFRTGFETGILRMVLGPDGVMFVGETARGWGSVGPKQQGIERVEWTGRIPFEIQEVTAQPDGFLLKFTLPVDRITAENPTSYAVTGFTYKYHETYGSPPVNRRVCRVRKVVVAADGLSVRLGVSGLREGYVHEVKAAGVRVGEGEESLVHPTAYYTLHRLPEGERILPVEAEPEFCDLPDTASTPEGASPKNPTSPPAFWTNPDGDVTLVLRALPGLKFDREILSVAAGQKVQLIFHNDDDMLHNVVFTLSGRGQAVGEAALHMGIEGAARHYVPETNDVLYYTRLVQPRASERLFFQAPAQPGEYDYICSFPGHMMMKGTLQVSAQ